MSIKDINAKLINSYLVNKKINNIVNKSSNIINKSKYKIGIEAISSDDEFMEYYKKNLIKGYPIYHQYLNWCCEVGYGRNRLKDRILKICNVAEGEI